MCNYFYKFWPQTHFDFYFDNLEKYIYLIFVFILWKVFGQDINFKKIFLFHISDYLFGKFRYKNV